VSLLLSGLTASVSASDQVDRRHPGLAIVGQNYPFTAAEYYQRADSVVTADFKFRAGK
jgi:hypothetical protein